MNEYVLEMKDISKNYGGIQAVSDVSLQLKKGEVLCLMGENGAGKSTLMKVLTGVEIPSKGEIFIHGKKVHITKPVDAYHAGVSIVHQELVQLPDMTVAENIFLGRYDKKAVFVDYKALRKRTLALMERLDLHYDPNSRIRQYSVAQRQLIEIMKALSYDSSIIVFDEPTATLTLEETNILYGIIRKLRADGISIIFISHRMDDIFAIGDRVHVLRDGRTTGVEELANLDAGKIIQMMIGRDIGDQFGTKTNTPGEVVLEVKGMANKSVKDVSFDVRAGEVLGLGGLIGAGRTEVLRALFGVDAYKGEVLFKGQAIRNKNPGDSISKGFAMVPEDRKDEGLILGQSIMQNMGLSVLGRLSRFGFMQKRKENTLVNKYVQDLNIRTPSTSLKVMMLSGGNQQKVVLAKCLASEPSVVLLDEPTRGVDVGAKSEIYKIINDLACKGFAVIMVSSELPELIAVSDRIAVMHEGKITGIVDARQATEESIMSLAI